MRLAELGERSGVPIATIKYYLREGLLAPGERIGPRTSEYGEEHLRRLRLVRALIHVGGLPVAKVREVLGFVDDESLGRTIRLGAALWALPQEPHPDGASEGDASQDAEADDAHEAALGEVDRLTASLGWEAVRQLAPISPSHASLVAAMAALRRIGYPWRSELLAPHAELMHQVAVLEFDFMETFDSATEQVEAAVAAALLFEPMLRALHRLAQEEESVRRYGMS
ncbi:transcriptional regulator [Mangrovactinospora gilvigrisea]|uniref:Transcriptional regulator n=1 Tax=Mangrovactinospora gilvigrisea TaxID=1428644 RepID=A0A1J7BC70_9ACTN|nr:MerR family transcriptional regulator [Mangrovactinospora gilvigrisea]OIV36189.1 transcriptional regulator [Mangrovactinospora gilvigrisea]